MEGRERLHADQKPHDEPRARVVAAEVEGRNRRHGVRASALQALVVVALELSVLFRKRVERRVVLNANGPTEIAEGPRVVDIQDVAAVISQNPRKHLGEGKEKSVRSRAWTAQPPGRERTGYCDRSFGVLPAMLLSCMRYSKFEIFLRTHASVSPDRSSTTRGSLPGDGASARKWWSPRTLASARDAIFASGKLTKTLAPPQKKNSSARGQKRWRRCSIRLKSCDVFEDT